MTTRVVFQDTLELALSELTTAVVRLRVRAMLAFVNVGNVDAHERIRKPVAKLVAVPRQRRIREGTVNDADSQGGEDQAEAKRQEGEEGVGGPDDAITVTIKEGNVLFIDHRREQGSEVSVCNLLSRQWKKESEIAYPLHGSEALGLLKIVLAVTVGIFVRVLRSVRYFGTSVAENELSVIKVRVDIDCASDLAVSVYAHLVSYYVMGGK